MKNGLYRAEVVARFPANPDHAAPGRPEADDCAMITDKNGMFFAKLHLVKITAKPRAKKSAGCYFCTLMERGILSPAVEIPGDGMAAHRVKYCFECGRQLQIIEEATE